MNKLVKSKLLPLLAAGILLVAGLGAAIPGAVTGDAPAVVKQAVTVTEVKSLVWTTAITTTAATGTATVGTVSADNTSFLAPVTVATGDSYQVQLRLKNSSKVGASAVMTIRAPAGFTVVQMQKDGTNVIGAAQVSATEWLVTLKADAETALDNLKVDIRTDDTISPGFYAIGITLKQVEG